MRQTDDSAKCKWPESFAHGRDVQGSFHRVQVLVSQFPWPQDTAHLPREKSRSTCHHMHPHQRSMGECKRHTVRPHHFLSSPALGASRIFLPVSHSACRRARRVLSRCAPSKSPTFVEWMMSTSRSNGDAITLVRLSFSALFVTHDCETKVIPARAELRPLQAHKSIPPRDPAN